MRRGLGFDLMAQIGKLVVEAIERRQANRRMDRLDAWEELCTSLDLERSYDGEALLNQYGDFTLIQRCHSEFPHLVLRGHSGRIQFGLSDLRCDSGRGGSMPRRLTLCVLDREGMQLPHSRLRPERWGADTLGEILGGKDVDIDFDNDPKFSKAYALHGLEEREVRGLFDARVRRWFVEHKRLAPYVETLGSSVVLAVPQLDASQVSGLLDQGLELLMLLSEWSDARVVG